MEGESSKGEMYYYAGILVGSGIDSSGGRGFREIRVIRVLKVYFYVLKNDLLGKINVLFFFWILYLYILL